VNQKFTAVVWFAVTVAVMPAAGKKVTVAVPVLDVLVQPTASV